jgi:PAS domain S-box-containing protein
LSEYINNREYRQKVLKELITELHNGKSVEEVKPRFEKLIEGISPTEISEMEQALIMEGMPVEEIQRLCDVHAAVFKGSIAEIHGPQKDEDVPGHPVHTFKLENKAIEEFIENDLKNHLNNFLSNDSRENLNLLSKDLEQLMEIEKHYGRKENLLFPYLEKYGITAPPKVMWGVDDEIRAELKEAINLLGECKGNKEEVGEKVNNVINRITEMIYKEEKILLPMALEHLTEDEWLSIEEASSEYGYCFIDPVKKWKPKRVNVEARIQAEGEKPVKDGYIKFETGLLLPEEIEAIFNTLPIDITFVDKDGIVKYFSQAKERIFPRPKTVIGRTVENCHPPASVHIVQQIVEDLQSGKKDHEDFWIKMKDMYAYIRYFAVRNSQGEFLGIVEVTQNIKPIQEITGEKRLLSE